MTEKLDAIDICLVYDVPPWLVSSEYPRCLRNRVLWQLLRVLHRWRYQIRKLREQRHL